MATDRELIYRLRPVIDPSAKATFKEFGDMGAAAAARFEEGAKKGMNGAKKAAEEFAGRSLKEWERVSEGIDRELRKREERAAAAAKRQSEKELKEWERVSEGIDKELRKREERAAAAAKKQADYARRLDEAELNRRKSVSTEDIEKAVKIQEKADEQAAHNASRSANELARAAAIARGEMRQGIGRLREGFEQATEGAMRLARGFTMMGLVGEKDTEKILQALLKIQSVIDLTRGAITTVRGITNAYAGYTAAVQAAAAAESARAAAAATANAAAGAAGAAGAGTSAAGAAGGGFALIAAKGAVAAGALAAIAASGYVVVDVFRQMARNGLGAGAVAGTPTDKIAELEVGIAARLGGADKFLQGIEMLKALNGLPPDTSPTRVKGDLGMGDVQTMEERRSKRIDFGAEQLKNEEELSRLRQAQENMALFSVGAGREFKNTPDDRLAMLQAQRGFASAGIKEAEGRVAEVDYRRRLMEQGKDSFYNSQEVEAADNAHAAALQRALDIERQIGETVKEKNRAALESLNEQLMRQKQIASAAESALKTARDSLQTDQERFGALDIGEQQGIRNLVDRLNKGEKLDREQQGRLGQFNEFRDRMREQLRQEGARVSQGLFTRGEQNVEAAERRYRAEVDLKGQLEVKVSAQITQDVEESEQALRDAMEPLIKQILEVQKKQGELLSERATEQLSRRLNIGAVPLGGQR